MAISSKQTRYIKQNAGKFVKGCWQMLLLKLYPMHIFVKIFVFSSVGILKSHLRGNWNRKIETDNDSFGRVSGYLAQP